MMARSSVRVVRWPCVRLVRAQGPTAKEGRGGSQYARLLRSQEIRARLHAPCERVSPSDEIGESEPEKRASQVSPSLDDQSLLPVEGATFELAYRTQFLQSVFDSIG